MPVVGPAATEVVAALPANPVGGDPVGQETEVAVFLGLVDNETAASVAEALSMPISLTTDLPGPVMLLEHASAAVGASRAVVLFWPFPGPWYPEASQGVPVGKSSRASGLHPPP